MRVKKPLPDFVVRFAGKDVYPERIPLPLLASALRAVQNLARGADEEPDADQPAKPTDPGNLGLLSVNRGSAVYGISSPYSSSDAELRKKSHDLSTRNLLALGKVLTEPETVGDNDYMLSPVEDLCGIARKLNAEIQIRFPGKEGSLIATIKADTYKTLSDKLFIYGDSQIFGRVQRVGGATERRCAMRIEGRARLLFCKVDNEETMRALGRELTEQVAASGRATWMRTNWKIVAFTITEIRTPSIKPFRELHEAMRRSGASDWDKIEDPDAFLKAHRGE
jgi:hypothetical protein